MATADEILAGAVEVASEDVTQDKVLRIDNELRTIAIPSTVKLLGVESDEDVNRLEFEMPRHYGEFDLSTFSVRVNYMNANGDGDIYRVIDLVADEEMMTFSWLVGRTAFMYKGDVQFVVCLKKIAEDFVVEQEFNTTVASLPVLQGLEPDEQLMQKYPDIIEQILKYMETPVSSEEIGKAVEEYLKENPVGGATINDNEVSAGSVWSSQKTSSQIGEKVSEHNMDQTTHADIRNLIVGLTNRLNALADSDDTTLDQLSEIVAYIKSNKGLIDAITTSKVSVSDIVDDLVTNSSNKPLSAAQGVRLKTLIDAIVPITVDSVLSSTSTNPVQNKVILSGLNEKENKGAVRKVQIGSTAYTPNNDGMVALPEMGGGDVQTVNGVAPDKTGNVSLDVVEADLEEATVVDGVAQAKSFLHKTVDGDKQFFSPLISAATVVRKDGSRLEQDGVISVDDALKLGGVEADKYLLKANAYQMELIWPNQSPASTFPPQTVVVDMSGYDYIVIDTLYGSYIGKPAIGDQIPMQFFSFYSETRLFIGRVAKIVETGIQFPDCYWYDMKNISNSPTIGNTHLVPRNIYGIKGVTSL